MPHFSLKAGMAVCAFALLGFAGQANATPRLTLNGTSSLTILAGDEENPEVENYLDPAQDNGAPKDETGPATAVPEPAEAKKPEPGEAKAAEPAKPDADMENKELQSQDR